LSIRHSENRTLRLQGAEAALAANEVNTSVGDQRLGSTPNEDRKEKLTTKENRTMKRNSIWVASFTAAVVIAIVLLVAGPPVVTASGQPSAANAAVNIDNFVFGPQTITIPVGATVTWTNKDDIPHTSVSTDGVFKSKVLDTDEKFSYKFEKAGTYPYYCTIHPKMTGKIIVQ
jgi:plastocyanin